MSGATADLGQENVRRWLAGRVAKYANTEAAGIEPNVPLPVYGLDSVNAVTLVVDIEEQYDLVLEPDALWEFGTIETLADHIIGRLGTVPSIE